MILNISQRDFISCMNDEKFFLPKRWDAGSFLDTLDELFNDYRSVVNGFLSSNQKRVMTYNCKGILGAIKSYHDGYPEKAYGILSRVMDRLFKDPIRIYKKDWAEAFEKNDPLELYRIRNTIENKIYERKDIFHTPYSLRSKISTCRYSIAGYPCLYLGTNLQLCCEEVKPTDFFDLRLAARFKFIRSNYITRKKRIEVLEFAVKPQDFVESHDVPSENARRGRRFDEVNLYGKEVMSNYIFWYPLIAACSFIRINKCDPFASEYIIPQLLMQWIRQKGSKNKLIGIRYFSCNSQRASDIGFNYAFPVSGEDDDNMRGYCKVLKESFRLTKPVFIHEYSSIQECELALLIDNDLQMI